MNSLLPNTKAVNAFSLADSNNPNSFVTDTTIDPNSVPIAVTGKLELLDILHKSA
jgi:hypothetical protein